MTLHTHHLPIKQIEEEQQLINELRKIEARKKEREKKTQDLQKLISADTDARKITKTTKKKLPQAKITKLDTMVCLWCNYCSVYLTQCIVVLLYFDLLHSIVLCC